MQIRYTDGLVRIGTHDRVIVGVWRAPFSHERLRALRSIVAEMALRHGNEIGLLGVFESESIQLSALADDAIRSDGANLQVEIASKVRGGQSVVIEGDGFAVSALRSAALTLQMISRVKEKPVFHRDVTEGISWLSTRMGLDGATGAEIRSLVGRLRDA